MIKILKESKLKEILRKYGYKKHKNFYDTGENVMKRAVMVFVLDDEEILRKNELKRVFEEV